MSFVSRLSRTLIGPVSRRTQLPRPVKTVKVRSFSNVARNAASWKTVLTTFQARTVDLGNPTLRMVGTELDMMDGFKEAYSSTEHSLKTIILHRNRTIENTVGIARFLLGTGQVESIQTYTSARNLPEICFPYQDTEKLLGVIIEWEQDVPPYEFQQVDIGDKPSDDAVENLTHLLVATSPFEMRTEFWLQPTFEIVRAHFRSAIEREETISLLNPIAGVSNSVYVQGFRGVLMDALRAPKATVLPDVRDAASMHFLLEAFVGKRIYTIEISSLPVETLEFHLQGPVDFLACEKTLGQRRVVGPCKITMRRNVCETDLPFIAKILETTSGARAVIHGRSPEYSASFGGN